MPEVTTKNVFPEVKVGDVIMSFDFHGRYDCYVVGLVTDIVKDLILFKGISRVWEGVKEANDTEYSAPLPGKMMMDERFPHRIKVIA